MQMHLALQSDGHPLALRLSLVSLPSQRLWFFSISNITFDIEVYIPLIINDSGLKVNDISLLMNRALSISKCPVLPPIVILCPNGGIGLGEVGDAAISNSDVCKRLIYRQVYKLSILRDLYERDTEVPRSFNIDVSSSMKRACGER